MAAVDPNWSLDALLRDYHPHSGWRNWFTEAYNKAMESTDPDERLDGWRIAAIIFGDMHVPLFCLFVCCHGRTLEPPDGKRFLGHIDLCLWELGLATPTRPDPSGTVAAADIGKPDGFCRDVEGTCEWLVEQLRPFGGRVERAAVFAMRLTAARFGLLRGPAEPSIAQVLDESLWERGAKKPWWKFW
jgi:hypothetical protein